MNATAPEQTAQARMNLAEALTDASRGIDRARRRLDSVIMALEGLAMPTATAEHIQRCRTGIVELEQLNNSIRRMNV